MILKTIMTSKRNLTIVSLDDSLETALKSIKEEGLHSIPVVQDEVFAGVIFKDDIYEACFSSGMDKALKEMKVKELINREIPVLNERDDIEKAGEAFVKNKLAFIPVENERGEFTGIITHTAVFREFAKIIGINKGYKISVLSYDTPGQIAKLSSIISGCGGNIISLAVIDPESVTRVKEILIRVETDDIECILSSIKKSGFRM